MEQTTSYAWLIAVVGGPILLGLVLWYGAARRRPRAAAEATAPRSYDQPGQRAAEQRERVASPPDH